MEGERMADEKEQRVMSVGEFTKITLSRKSEDVVKQIYEALLRGDLKPHQRLSSESELAEAFGVSKLTVREAVRSLELMEIVEVRKGGSGGLFIREPDLVSIAEKIESIMRIPNIAVTDITETRSALETHILRESLPKQKIPKDMMEKLEENITLSQQYLATGETLKRLRANFDFHLMIASLTNNNMLIMLHRVTCGMLLRFFELAHPSREMAVKSIDAHRRILAAIRDRDFDKAAVINIEHMWIASTMMTEKSKQQSPLRVKKNKA